MSAVHGSLSTKALEISKHVLWIPLWWIWSISEGSYPLIFTKPEENNLFGIIRQVTIRGSDAHLSVNSIRVKKDRFSCILISYCSVLCKNTEFLPTILILSSRSLRKLLLTNLNWTELYLFQVWGSFLR